MFYNNPFSGLTEIVSPLAIQGFTILMVGSSNTRNIDGYNS